MVFDIWETDRAAAEVLPNGLKLVRADGPGKPTVKIFKPKAVKPWYHYSFPTIEKRENFVARVVTEFEAYQDRKKAYRQERATGDPAALRVGTVMYYSWGYDQTNIEYWQVVKQQGRFAWVRQIGQELVEQTGFMSENVRPAVDQFLAPNCAFCSAPKHFSVHQDGCATHTYMPGEPVVLKKLIQFYGGSPCLKMDYGSLTPVKGIVRFGDGTPPLAAVSHHQSHYH
jgi:hypothetical protein